MTNGCYIPMTADEKVLNAATTFRGQTYFGTNKPPSRRHMLGQSG